MTRLTRLYENGQAYIMVNEVKLLRNELVGEPITRLAQYESFGLAPAEIGLLISKNNADFLENEILKTITANIPLDRLQEICEAERNNRIIILPCKRGDTVYVILSRFKPKITETKAMFVWFDGFDYKITCEGIGELTLGRSVFLTEAEARERLKALEGMK